MAKDNDNIPVNCDKILFAEDVVSHILSKILQVQYQPAVAAPYREFIYQGFDETVKMALDDIYKRVVTYNMLFNVAHQSLNRYQFHRFAMKFLKKYFKEGFDPRYLLYYSVHLSMAAAKMVDSIGLQNAGNLAVQYILKGFRGCDMFTGGWDVLHMMASTYANRRDFMDNLTPDIDMMGAPDVGDADDDNDGISDEEDSNEDNHQLQNAEVANGLDNKDNEQGCASEQDLEENHKLVNKDVKVCLDDLKDILEKELELEIIQGTSDSTDSSHQKHASNKQAKPNSFLMSSREKTNSPALKLNLSSVEEKDIRMYCAVVKDLASPELQKTRSPKRDHEGFQISRSICMSDIPSSSSYFISKVLN